ncbi:MAG: ABC transporter permease [Burkholderiales bacterium]|nr:ABC transporter permease [Burkholderiales bacterium]
MTKLITDHDVSISNSNNEITLHVELGNDSKHTIVAYYLLHGNAVIEKIFSSALECSFIIRRNQSYRVKVFYKDECGNNQAVFSKTIKPELICTSIDEIKNNITIGFDKNKIICDTSKCNNLFYRIKSYEFILDDYNDKIESNHSIIKYNIKKSGDYKVIVAYEDYNGVIQFVEFKLHAIYEEISSHLIDSKSLENISEKSLRLIFYILYAFIFREFQRKYDSGYFRYFSIFVGPAVRLGLLVFIFTLMGRHTVVGLSIPLFILTGLLPYSFFSSAGNCLTIVSGNKALLNYRQIKIIDVILSNVIMELLVSCVVFCSGVLVCKYFGLNVIIYNPLSLILSCIVLFVLTFGLGMVLSVIGFYFAEFSYAIQVLFRALFYLSGVFFSIENIPIQYQRYLLWNPLLQIIEFIRFSFVSFDLPRELSYTYLIKCTLTIFLLGLSMYFVNRNKFMINDRAR